MPRPDPATAARTIGRVDPAFRALVRRVGPPPRRRAAPVAARFASLTRSVTYQLLATKAAATIHARVVALCEDEVTPERILAAGHDHLRAVGLSHAKAAAMLDLAERTLDGRLALARHGAMSDADVTREVVAARGLGVWSAHMYLMQTLGRPDVWPTGDFGVRHGWSLLHGLDEPVTERALRPLGDPFAGVRSEVAWYCWRAVELERAR
ncbi:MAG TPA: hypothetical protein PLS29_00500 [Acidimicrobiales bacterium]|nr:hypothetical protein [Acidimicrobiales bacterium]